LFNQIGGVIMSGNIFGNTKKFIILSIIALSAIVSTNGLFGYKLILVNESNEDVVFKYDKSDLLIVPKGGSFICKGFWEPYTAALDRFVKAKGGLLDVSKHDRLYYDKGFISKTFGISLNWLEILRHFYDKTQAIYDKTITDIASLDKTESNSFVVLRFLNRGYIITFIDKDGKGKSFTCGNYYNFFGMYSGTVFDYTKQFELSATPAEIYSRIFDAMDYIIYLVKNGDISPLVASIKEFNDNSEFMGLLGGKLKFENELREAKRISENGGPALEKKKDSSKVKEQELPDVNLYGKGKDAGYKRVDKGFKPGVGPEKYKSAKK
jgi:hypothetical protein